MLNTFIAAVMKQGSYFSFLFLQTRRTGCTRASPPTITIPRKNSGSPERIRRTGTTRSGIIGTDQRILLRCPDLSRSRHEPGLHRVGDDPIPHPLDGLHTRSGQGLHHPKARFLRWYPRKVRKPQLT